MPQTRYVGCRYPANDDIKRNFSKNDQLIIFDFEKITENRKRKPIDYT